MTYLIIAVLALPIIGMLAFTSLPAARRFKRECWGDLPWDWRIALTIFIFLGLLGDFVYNQTRAVYLFRGFEALLLSNRVQHRVDRGLTDTETRRWVRILNTGDRGHIKIPEEWLW